MDEAQKWLVRHGLDAAGATPVLAARLAVRRSARLGNSLLLAGLFIAASLVQVFQMSDSSQPRLAVLLAVVAGALVATQFQLDRWVRGVDQRMGATLSRRATHPVPQGWQQALGLPHAALWLVTFLCSAALAVSALPPVGATALVLLVAVCGVGAVDVMRLHHLVTRPVVAEDATSLSADVIMRREDARDTSVPSVLLALPVVLLFGTAPGWWGAAAMTFCVVGTIGLVVVQVKTQRRTVAVS